MSEPMTTHEIEDVLSSIRRLVSEDLRPAPGRPVAKPADSKLILTPALRVVSERLSDQTPTVEIATAPPAVTGLMAYHDGFDLTPTEPVPTLADWGAGVWDESPKAIDDDTLDEGVSDPVGHDLAAEVVVEAPMWSDAVGDAPVWDDDTAETWVAEEPIPFVAHPRKPVLAANPLAQAWADRAEADVRAELQTAVEAKLTTKPEATPSPQIDPAAQDDAGLFRDDAVPFDEEALREVVRDIIREELAGALGERITRNVRKLVRVEINRALSTRDLDQT